MYIVGMHVSLQGLCMYARTRQKEMSLVFYVPYLLHPPPQPQLAVGHIQINTRPSSTLFCSRQEPPTYISHDSNLFIFFRVLIHPVCFLLSCKLLPSRVPPQNHLLSFTLCLFLSPPYLFLSLSLSDFKIQLSQWR